MAAAGTTLRVIGRDARLAVAATTAPLYPVRHRRPTNGTSATARRSPFRPDTPEAIMSPSRQRNTMNIPLKATPAAGGLMGFKP